MSRLRIYTDTAPESTLLDSRDGAVIAAELARIGVTFERWQANQPIAPGARGKVFAAYRDDIDRLVPRAASRAWTWPRSPRTTRTAPRCAQVPRRALPQGRRGALLRRRLGPVHPARGRQGL
jgi:hypothetical protein